MSAEEDAADVASVLAGDVSAFEAIVRRWQTPLVNLAYRFCRDRGRAEDMTQEAFLRAYRSLASWRKDAAFSTWLFALATNLYRSEIRRLPPLAARWTQAWRRSTGARPSRSSTRSDAIGRFAMRCWRCRRSTETC